MAFRNMHFWLKSRAWWHMHNCRESKVSKYQTIYCLLYALCARTMTVRNETKRIPNESRSSDTKLQRIHTINDWFTFSTNETTTFPFCTINYIIYINHSGRMQRSINNNGRKLVNVDFRWKTAGKVIIENGNIGKTIWIQMKIMFRVSMWLKFEMLFSNQFVWGCIESEWICIFTALSDLFKSVEKAWADFLFFLFSPFLISPNNRQMLVN